MATRIEVLEGDITTFAVDAIVNAANEALAGGGGVDGAIHRAAGPGLADECRAIPFVRPYVRCPTGEARITGGHRLSARHVIHTVGPIWHGGRQNEPALLAGCYRQCLDLAAQHGLHSLAFPAISCGVFGYPVEQAVNIAVREVRAWLAQHALPQRVIFCCFGQAMAQSYHAALQDGSA